MQFKICGLVMIVVLCTICINPTFAEDEKFTFFLDKSQYNQRDVIEVSGWVTKVHGLEIYIEIRNQNDQIILQDITKLVDSQKIEYKIPTLGSEWNNPGFYTIRLNYENETQSRLFAFGNFDLEEFKPQISLDKSIYSWTDIIRMEILSPNDNQNNYQIDKIKVDVSSSLSTLKSYVLEETGKSDGIFTGMITLTGDSNFDVNRDGRGGDALGYTSGPGPDEGYLEARANDRVKVSFSSSHYEKTVEKTAQIQFHLAKIEWVDKRIDPNQKVIVRVTDPDMRLHPIKKDKVEVFISSFPQGYSKIFTLTETEINSGIFEGYITFIQFPAEDGVLVKSGTEVSAKYIDRTLPSNLSLTPEVVDTAKVIDLGEPWGNLPDEPGVVTEEPQKILDIPYWVRGNARLWAQGAIEDSDFVFGIQYLIKERIMTIPENVKITSGSKEIPFWIKNNADWWSQGLISDHDFVKGIQFLIETGIMKV